MRLCQYMRLNNINNFAGGTVIPQLLNWIGQHFPQCDEKARNVLAGSASSGYDQVK